MNRLEEQAYILNWVKTIRKDLLEPKKRGPKTDEIIVLEDEIFTDEEGKRYRINGYRHRVYLE